MPCSCYQRGEKELLTTLKAADTPFMSPRRTAFAAVPSLLPLGSVLILGSTTALATCAVLLSTQAAHAQSAALYYKRCFAKGKSADYQGAIAG